MQSGITGNYFDAYKAIHQLIRVIASKELQEAFGDLVSNPTQRGLTVSIKDETLVPVDTIPAKGSFEDDLSLLAPLLKDNEAAYIILRRYGDVSDTFIAVTYVPDIAKVRSKMLFASTRLTLTRELGGDKFRETIFATMKSELTAEGFRKHDKHGELKAPLTEEEQTLERVKAAEEAESRGTSSRSSHVSSGVAFPISNEGLAALKGLESGADNLVQLKIDVAKETIELVSSGAAEAGELSTVISNTEPRFSFFRYTHTFEGAEESPLVFIYTCPTASKVRERMMYATSRLSIVRTFAESEAGLTIAKRVSLVYCGALTILMML
jgi:twinfilin